MKIHCTCWACEHIWTEQVAMKVPELATCPKCRERMGEILAAGEDGEFTTPVSPKVPENPEPKDFTQNHPSKLTITTMEPEPEYAPAAYLAHGITMIEGVMIWFEDKEISRDPALGVLVERRNQDTGKLLLTYLLPQDFVERDMNRPGKSIHQLQWKRKLRLRNCKVWHESTPFETLPGERKP